MFAVPGWSVSSASLKRQRGEIIGGESGVGGLEDDEGLATTKKASRKRKRGDRQPVVTQDNVAELWEKVIERNGDPKSKVHGASVAQKKKRKVQPEESKEPVQAAQTEEEDEADDHTLLPPSTFGSEKNAGKRKRKHDVSKNEKTGRLKGASAESPAAAATHPPSAASLASASANIKLTPLQASMRQKLTSARFRHLNQSLYSTSSAESFKLFQENPEMFEEYHEGFRRQVEVWPENPVDGYVQELGRRAKIRERRHRREGKRGEAPGGSTSSNATHDLASQPLPRTDGICTIADLGCGDAKLAQSMEASGKKLKLKILSYDLYSPNAFVTKADMAHLPCGDGSVDVVICCLALMGTNWIDFIEEAYRILRWKGELWVAEIKSRFGRVNPTRAKNGRKDLAHRRNTTTTTTTTTTTSTSRLSRKPPREDPNHVNNDDEDDAQIAAEIDGHETTTQETDVSAFVDVLRRRGFALQGSDLSNKMFVKMTFLKSLSPSPTTTKENGSSFSGLPGRGAKSTQTKFLPHRSRPRHIDDPDQDDEQQAQRRHDAAVLKPCVYKIR